MPAQWTGEILAEMHLNGISAKKLASHMGKHPKYVSAIMNGHRSPKHAEQMFRAALDDLVRLKSTNKE